MGGEKPKPGAAELAYRSIRSDIISGALAEGERLTEERLSHDLGLSRTPVREAIRRLTLEGFVSRQSGYTTRVARFPEDEMKQAFDIRQMLEGYACERAAERATEEDIEEIARHSETISRHTPPKTQEDYVRIAEANELFHRKVVEAARSPRLTALMSMAFDVGMVVAAIAATVRKSCSAALVITARSRMRCEQGRLNGPGLPCAHIFVRHKLQPPSRRMPMIYRPDLRNPGGRFAEHPCRSLLFVPATRPSAFGKALDSGADIACVDLEDAVPPQEKNTVRAEAVAYLSRGRSGEAPLRALRINAPNTKAGLRDVLALLETPPATGLIVVPKVREAAELRSLDALLTEVGCDVGLAALIETLDGLENVSEIASACQRVKMLIFGAVDMSAELGVPNTAAAMAYARARIVHAGRRFGLDVMDVPSLDFRNSEAAASEAKAARALGFTGKAAIHPATLAEINAAFTPSADEIGQAERVIAAFEASPNGLAVLDGQLVEAPVVKAMQKVLAVARRVGLR